MKSLLISILVLLAIPSTVNAFDIYDFFVGPWESRTVTWFPVENHFRCQLGRPFCVYAEYVESDNLGFDPVESFGLICLDTERLLLSRSFRFTEDDGLFQDFIEPAVLIYHNCTQTGQVLKIQKDLPPIQLDTLQETYEYYLNLLDRGTMHIETRQLWTAARFFPRTVEKWIRGKPINQKELSSEKNTRHWRVIGH